MKIKCRKCRKLKIFGRLKKTPGISILIAFSGSLLVLLITLGVLFSVQKSLDQTAALERSMKFSFAAESGVEAAIYHHNARGTGVQFLDSAEDSQKIAHGAVETNWKIEGRAEKIIGLLKEEESVQIPLFWDPAADPSETLNTTDISNSGSLKMTFYNNSTIMNSDDEDEFHLSYNSDVIIPNNFEFGDSTKIRETLIDWSLTRNDSSKGVQTFTPLEPCLESTGTTTTDFICEDLFIGDTDGFVISSVAGDSDTGSSGGDINGRTTPGLTETNFNEFLSCDISSGASGSSACSNYTLTFKMLLPTEEEAVAGGRKIPGIPYVVEYSELGAIQNIPKSTYTIESSVSDDKFAHSVTVKIPERTTIGAFDYVILD